MMTLPRAISSNPIARNAESHIMSLRPTLLASPLAGFLSRLALAPRQEAGALTLWPLVLRDPSDLAHAPGTPIAPLSEALAAGAARVVDLGPGGIGPQLRVENDGDAALLVLFGEELRSETQQRVANASFLVRARSSLVIDVACIGREPWVRRPGARFLSGGSVASHALRRKMAPKIATARVALGRFVADQREVWDEVEARLARARVDGPAAGFAEFRAAHAAATDALAAHFHPVFGQLGFVAAVGDGIAGLEAVGRPDLFTRTFPSLLRAYAIDAIEAIEGHVPALEEAHAARYRGPEPFVTALASVPAGCGPSLGLGDDLRFDAAGLRGCALVAGDVIHATAFPV